MSETRRLGMLPFLLAVVALAVAGTWAVSAAWALSPVAGIAAALAAWALLFPVARMRLADLGRAPDDLVWLAVPGLGQLFVLVLLAPTPSVSDRARRVARWEGQVSGWGVFSGGVRLALRSWWLVLGLALVFGAAETFAGEELLALVDWLEGLDPETRGIAGQVLSVVAVVLGLYALVQLAKRRTASRVSWIPALFFVPVGLLAATVHLVSVPGTEPARLALVYTGWTLLYASIAGAALAVAWVTMAVQLSDHDRLDAGEVLRRVVLRTPDVSAPHGAKVHAVQIGLQVIVPGIFYAVQMAFVDMVAVLEPQAASLKRSARLTWGIRSRILKALVLGVLVAMGGSLVAAWAIEGRDGMLEGLMVPGSMGVWPTLIGDVVGIAVFGAVTMGFVAMYRERSARLAAIDARRREERGEPPVETPEPVEPRGHPASLVGLGVLACASGLFLVSQAGQGWVLVALGMVVMVLAVVAGRRGD